LLEIAVITCRTSQMCNEILLPASNSKAAFSLNIGAVLLETQPDRESLTQNYSATID